MTITVPLNAVTGPTLKQRLARAERVNRWKAQALIAPLVLFLLLVFLVPIVALLYKSVGNPEVVGGMPRTVAAIASWDGRGLPAEPVYKAAGEDLAEARKNQTLGDLSKRLNMELAGYRSLLTKTARSLPFASEPASYKEALEGLDERWGDPAYWQAVKRNTSSITPFYLLAAVDHRIDDLGELAPATPDQAIYLDIFARTFWMGLIITVICLVLAYPLAYLLANLPSRQSNLLMILVLLPFWYLGQALSSLNGYYEHFGGNPDSPIAWGVSAYSPLYNLLWMNNGYHAEHHYRPKMHWTRVKAFHREIAGQQREAGVKDIPVAHGLGFLVAHRKD